MTTGDILLARHGQTAENAGGRILGHRDPPLSATGLEQARTLARGLRGAGIRRVWTSPLRRARQTADVVAAGLGLEAHVLDDLIESARGSWEGLALADIARDAPELHAAFVAGRPDFAFPGGESLRDQEVRTARALETVAAADLPALVVAHAGTVRTALRLHGSPVPPESALAHGEVVARLPVRWPGQTSSGLRRV